MIEYYALRGVDWTKKYPSGMFRIIRHDNTVSFERMNANGNWVEDSSLIRHIAGYSNDAELITKDEADEILKYYKNKKI